MTEALARLELPRQTIDVDGSVIRTGATVGWAFRGAQPPSPEGPERLSVGRPCAQTGHILRLKSRPGNVHDPKQAVPFLRVLIDDLRDRFGRRMALEFRMDAAFFQRGILHLLAARECGYAIRVGCWSWLPSRRSPPPAGAGTRSPRGRRAAHSRRAGADLVSRGRLSTPPWPIWYRSGKTESGHRGSACWAAGGAGNGGRKEALGPPSFQSTTSWGPRCLSK